MAAPATPRNFQQSLEAPRKRSQALTSSELTPTGRRTRSRSASTAGGGSFHESAGASARRIRRRPHFCSWSAGRRSGCHSFVAGSAITGKRPQAAMKVRDPSARADGPGVGVGFRLDRIASSVRLTANDSDRQPLPRLATSSVQLGALRVDGPQAGREAKDAVRTCRTEHRARSPEHERTHGQELGSSKGGCEPARGHREAVEA